MVKKIRIWIWISVANNPGVDLESSGYRKKKSKKAQGAQKKNKREQTRGCHHGHSSVTSLTSLWSRASHIIASDEDLGDAMNEVICDILTKCLHHDICAPAMYVDGLTEGKLYCYRTHIRIYRPKGTPKSPSANREPKNSGQKPRQRHLVRIEVRNI